MSAHASPEQLGAYLDGELDASARATVDAHLRDCGECGAHLADLAALDDAAREVPLGVPDGYFEGFAPRVRARLAKKRPARWRPPVWGWAAAAALLLAVITPLALRERRLGEDAAAGYKQNEGFAPAAAPTAPPATVAVPHAPAPGAAAPEEQDRLAERTAESRLARRDRVVTREGGRVEPAAGGGPAAHELQAQARPKREEPAPEKGTLADSKLAEQKKADDRDGEMRALGYVATPPPPSAQRQYGPRAQNTAPVPAGAATSKAAAEPKDKKATAYAEAGEPAAGNDAPAAALQESVEVTPRPRDVSSGPASAKFRSLAESPQPRADGDARRLREAWRTFAAENPDHPQADEARVRLVETGALAYRLGHRPQDRVIALRDARAYLERPAAPQADRVRAALKTLEPGAP